MERENSLGIQILDRQKIRISLQFSLKIIYKPSLVQRFPLKAGFGCFKTLNPVEDPRWARNL